MKSEAPNPEFPISLRAACSLLKHDPHKFSRLIVGRKERKYQDSVFVPEEDFTFIMTGTRAELYMTTRCFAQAAMKTRGGTGDMVREYFYLN
jgi:hypothetical protein